MDSLPKWTCLSPFHDHFGHPHDQNTEGEASALGSVIGDLLNLAFRSAFMGAFYVVLFLPFYIIVYDFISFLKLSRWSYMSLEPFYIVIYEFEVVFFFNTVLYD